MHARSALALSLLGDVLPVLRGERSDRFLAGLTSFVGAHVAYVVAFVLATVDGTGLVVGTAPVLASSSASAGRSSPPPSPSSRSSWRGRR